MRNYCLFAVCALAALSLAACVPEADTDDVMAEFADEIAQAGANQIPASLTASGVVAAMKVGWNLGNTLDSYSGGSYDAGWIETSGDGSPSSYETAWGNPVTTKAMIEEIKARGFGAVRVPVTWGSHINADGTIDEAWLTRVETVVGYVLDSGLYCIVNVHHDTGADSSSWLKASSVGLAAREAKFQRLWARVALRFRDRGERLLFEGFNEILDDKSSWGSPSADSLAVVNQLNQLFVDTVRATGGNNSGRVLVVNTYAASTAKPMLDGFVLPTDTIDNRLIVELHDYSPTDFAWQQENVSWATTRDTWGGTSDVAALRAIFDRVYARFGAKGIPAIIGEFSTCNKNNTAERIEHATEYVSYAKTKGITCFWWDEGGTFEANETYGWYTGAGLLNRRTLAWPYPDLADALIQAAE